MNTESDSHSIPVRELQPILAATETVTETGLPPQEPESLAAQLEAALAECRRLEGIQLEADTRLRQVRTDYGNRLIQLEQDAAAEHQTNENLLKKIETLEQSLAEQTLGMRKIKQQLSEPAAEQEKAKAELE